MSITSFHININAYNHLVIKMPWKDTFAPIQTFSSFIKNKEEECEKYELKIKKFDQKSFGWVVNTQKRLNMYIKEFQNSFYPKLRTAVEEEQVGNLQGQYIAEIMSSIPQEDSNVSELFSIKLLETFALHNRNLAVNWTCENNT